MSDTQNMNKWRIAWYATTIFLSSAILLVLEITAGRLIAPYVGVSIYSWTSIIGVILAGLSLGNWLGGHWADRGANETSTGIILALAGLFSLFSLLALTLVAPVLQNSQLDLVSSSFLYVLSMFFIPSILLGIPTPILTTLALKLDGRTGHIVGRMHALAAFGSIIGTFLTGYVLIQYFGSRNVIIVSALLLFLLALPFLYRKSKLVSIAVILLTVGLSSVIHARNGFTNPCDKESNYFCLRVVDVSSDVPFGRAKALILDHLLHGINHDTRPDMLVSPYVHLMDELIKAHFTAPQRVRLNYFFAGGGSYTQPRMIMSETPDAQITVAELDSAVTAIVQKNMYVSTKDMEIIHGDARTTLYRHAGEKFDVIVTDAFHDVAIPYHLVTLEFMQLVKQRMHPAGLFITNVVDAYPDPRMVKSLAKTLWQEFKYVDIWADQLPQQPQRMTYVISASNSKVHNDVLHASSGFKRSWHRINQLLLASGTPDNALPVFTDDYVPVERMIAKLLLTTEGL